MNVYLPCAWAALCHCRDGKMCDVAHAGERLATKPKLQQAQVFFCKLLKKDGGKGTFKSKSGEAAYRIERLQVLVIFELAGGKTLHGYPEILLPDSMSVVRNLCRQTYASVINTANAET